MGKAYRLTSLRFATAALEQICTAYASIGYATEDHADFSIVCMGVAGVSADALKCAEAVNTAKAALRGICAPLQRINMRVPVKGDDGPTKAIPQRPVCVQLCTARVPIVCILRRCATATTCRRRRLHA
jgi:hypothetical protein